MGTPGHTTVAATGPSRGRHRPGLGVAGGDVVSGANYAHCDHEPCLRPTGSTKVFYDADTDIPEGTVIMHPDCHRDASAAAERAGYEKAIANLRDREKWAAWRKAHAEVALNAAPGDVYARYLEETR